MKVYIASKVHHYASWLELRDKRPDVQFTSTWIDEAGEGETSDYTELAERCIREVLAADFILLYCTTNEVLKGALIEVGAALAMGKEIRCVGDTSSLSRVFCRHRLWKWFSSIEQALNPDNSKGKRCVICGARVRNHNPKTITCSPECTAKRYGKPAPQEVPFKKCAACGETIADNDTSCASCGATDFDGD